MILGSQNLRFLVAFGEAAMLLTTLVYSSSRDNRGRMSRVYRRVQAYKRELSSLWILFSDTSCLLQDLNVQLLVTNNKNTRQSLSASP